MHNDIQDVLGQNYGVPDDIDEDDLMGELDALEADMTLETEHEAAGVPAYLQVQNLTMHVARSRSTLATFRGDQSRQLLHCPTR